MNINIRSIKLFLLFLLLVAIIPLRFYQLGYSDYISDEPGTFFYRGNRTEPQISKIQFLLNQPKGPMELFVGYIPYLIMGNYTHELAQRIPFAVAGSLSIIVFYLFLLKVTKQPIIAFTSSFLLLVNGLITAYGRIAQYQDLVLLFSFTSLYFYSSILSDNKKHLIPDTLVGTLFFCLAFLSHWYALFLYLPVSLYFYKYLKNQNVGKNIKIKMLVYNIILCCLLLLPFLIPYIKNYSANSINMVYADSILGFGKSFANRTDFKQFKLYNPFLVLEFYVVGIIISFLFLIKDILRKRQLSIVKISFLFWFTSVLLIFRYFIKYSGLHFYQIIIPGVILCGYAINEIYSIFPKMIKILFFILISLFFIFFYYQTYLLFVDSNTEYPWETANILWFTTPAYSQSDDLRSVTGFPHKRYWSQINTYINQQNINNSTKWGFISNENKDIIKYYMDTPNDRTKYYYAIGIKDPYSFANDYKFSQIHRKKLIHSISNESGESVVLIYLVTN